MELCGVVGNLIIVPFRSEVMATWLGWRQKSVKAEGSVVDFVGF